MTTARQWAADQARARARRMHEVYAPLSEELATLGALRAEALTAHAEELEAVTGPQPDVLPDVATLQRLLYGVVAHAVGASTLNAATWERIRSGLNDAAALIDRQATALESEALKAALDRQAELELELRAKQGLEVELRAERELHTRRIVELEALRDELEALRTVVGVPTPSTADAEPRMPRKGDTVEVLIAGEWDEWRPCTVGATGPSGPLWFDGQGWSAFGPTVEWRWPAQPADAKSEPAPTLADCIAAEREKVARLERERDELAAQLAALREAAQKFAAAVHGGRPQSTKALAFDAVLADTAPAAEAHARRVQAETLESIGIRREVLAFARIMETRLRAHDDRGSRGWVECEPKWLLKRLREETKELQEAIERKPCGCRSAGECMHGFAALGIDGPHEEAADVANFAMMIADVCGYLDENADSARAAKIRGGR